MCKEAPLVIAGPLCIDKFTDERADSTLKCNSDVEEYFMGRFHVQGFSGSVIELVHYPL